MSSVKLFIVTVQIFVYKFLFTIVFFGKKKNNTHETFHILKMKAPSNNETIFPSYYVEVCRISSLYSKLSIMDKERTITDMDKSITFPGSCIDRDL